MSDKKPLWLRYGPIAWVIDEHYWREVSTATIGGTIAVWLSAAIAKQLGIIGVTVGWGKIFGLLGLTVGAVVVLGIIAMLLGYCLSWYDKHLDALSPEEREKRIRRGELFFEAVSPEAYTTMWAENQKYEERKRRLAEGEE